MSSSLIVPRSVTVPSARAQTCRSCRHVHKDKDGDLVCRAHPPTAFLIGEPLPPPHVGKVGFRVRAAFPVVAPDQWCGEWTAVLDS